MSVYEFGSVSRRKILVFVERRHKAILKLKCTCIKFGSFVCLFFADEYVMTRPRKTGNDVVLAATRKHFRFENVLLSFSYLHTNVRGFY